MLREMLALLLGLFIAFTEIFNFKDMEAPALSIDYYPSVRKKENNRLFALGRVL